jgi:hypothetical protein
MVFKNISIISLFWNYTILSQEKREKSFEKNAIEVWNREWDKSWDIDMKWIYIMIGRHLSLKFISWELHWLRPNLDDY